MKSRHLFLVFTLLFANSVAIAADTTQMPMPQVQRNCPYGGDIYIDRYSQPQYSKCVWKGNDDHDIQVTLHVTKDVDYVVAQCTFVPVSTDKIGDVRASKSGNSSGSARPVPLPAGYQIITGNNIRAIFRNYNTVFDNDCNDTVSHINAVFYLSSTRYQGDDTIYCTFAPMSFPEGQTPG